jgi:hypothetical protein
VVGSGIDGEHAQLWEQALQSVEVWGRSSAAHNLSLKNVGAFPSNQLCWL